MAKKILYICMKTFNEFLQERDSEISERELLAKALSSFAKDPSYDEILAKVLPLGKKYYKFVKNILDKKVDMPKWEIDTFLKKLEFTHNPKELEDLIYRQRNLLKYRSIAIPEHKHG